jgi:hypothetical protein
MAAARRSAAMVVALTFWIAACTGGSSPSIDGPGGSTASAAPGASIEASPAASTGSGASPGEMVVQGSLTTTGTYEATWTWTPGDDFGTGPVAEVTIASDKGGYAAIKVNADGSWSVISGSVPEISMPAGGSGAQVVMTSQTYGDTICGFTVDGDIGPGLHMAGTMTFVGSDGVFTC